MATLEDIKGKIKTAQDLQSVVKTMKALAAVSIRQYERAVESLDEYYRTVQLGFQVILKNQPEELTLAPEPAGELLGAVVFGSDQGMCGQLNEQILTHALETMDGLGIAVRNRFIMAVGVRIADRLQDEGQLVQKTFSVPSSAPGIVPQAYEVLIELEKWHAHRKVHRVVLLYSQHLSMASYRPTTAYLLPVEEWWLRTLQEKEWPTKVLPTFTMDWQLLFRRLVRQHLFVSLYRAFAESLASEHASRLTSMQGAEKNIEDRLGELWASFHRRRQMSITEELLDIVSGFTALSDEKPH
ncbi:MAG: F0F1 ATP synthase subunit gamma [Thermodesulfobacteriota bacterium]